jgi:hypothetical protein
MSNRIDTEPEGFPRPPLGPRMRTETPAPPIDPSPGVRIAQQVREGLTDLAGLALLGYLATRQLIPGTWAVIAMLALLVPAPVLLRLAKVLEARYGRGVASAAVLVAASSAYATIKQGAVVVTGAAVAIGACS